MKQFGIILKFELMNYLKNKVFVGVTAAFVALIVIVMFFPRISNLISGANDSSGELGEQRSVMLISAESPETAGIIRQAFEGAFPAYEVKLVEGDSETVKEKVSSGEAQCGFHIDSLTSYVYYVNDLSMYDANTAVADEVLQSIYRAVALQEEGIPPERTRDILGVQIEHETVSIGKDQMQTFFYAYVMVFALYMVILLYGQMVATNVATEKSSRAMELLITSARPTSMMFGKVVASCIAGLLQLIAIFGSALLCFHLNKSYWDGNQIISSVFDMPVGILVYLLIFFVLGFFMYAFMYGAIGSTASKLEDINTSIMPVTMLFIVGFFVVMFSMGSGKIDNTLMMVCSFLPFTSPMAMFTRIAMSSVPFYEIAISVAILIGSVFGIGVFAAKIYRVGVLLYGTPPKIGAVLRILRNK